MQKKSQSYNDGGVRIYEVRDVSESGKLASYRLFYVCSLRYQERVIGYKRHYTAQQTSERIDMLLRCPLYNAVLTEYVAVPNDGEQYDIKLIQPLKDIQSMDITLQRRPVRCEYA